MKVIWDVQFLSLKDSTISSTIPEMFGKLSISMHEKEGGRGRKGDIFIEKPCNEGLTK